MSFAITMRVIIFILILSNAYGQNLTEHEIEMYTVTIDSLKAQGKLDGYSYPNMSFCGGGLDGFYYDDELVYIEAPYQGETGYTEQKVYFKDSIIYKIMYREYLPDWDKFHSDSLKAISDDYYSTMTYTDTLYAVSMTENPIFVKSSNGEIVSNESNSSLLKRLLQCAEKMKLELESEKISHKNQ